MPMYNLFEYSKNYEKTTGSLWNYYRDKPIIDDDDEITHYLKSKSFDYKSSVIGKLGGINNGNVADRDGIRIVISLKHLSTFWRMLSIPLINCEVSFTLTLPEDCVILRWLVGLI